MVAKNDITGDSIRSKGLSQQGRDNWDKIFGNKDDDPEVHPIGDLSDTDEYEQTTGSLHEKGFRKRDV